MKYQCIKTDSCSICKNKGTIQTFLNSAYLVKYARHYKQGIFNYCKLENLEEVEKLFKSQTINDQKQNGQVKTRSNNRPKSSHNLRTRAGGEGFEPSTPNLGEADLQPNSKFWFNFQLFLKKECKAKCMHQLLNNSQTYGNCLIHGNLSILKTFSDGKRLNIMKALSALAKFSGTYERYKRSIKAHGLKWAINNDDIIIARLIKYSENRSGNSNELFEWMNAVKRQIPDFAIFIDFAIATGLRLDEAINSYRLIVELSEQGKLSEYYNAEKQVLEHFRFKALFIRRTKKAFMSFASQELIDSVRLSGFHPSTDIIKKRLQRAGLNLRFGDLRELWASRGVRHLRQPEIDFLQGRVSASVFMQNYFNQTWICDLKKRVPKNSKQLLAFSS